MCLPGGPGVLRTAVADMDRETQEEYLVVLEAKDMGGHLGGLSGTTTVTVTLADVNDNPPYFRRSKSSWDPSLWGQIIRSSLGSDHLWYQIIRSSLRSSLVSGHQIISQIVSGIRSSDHLSDHLSDHFWYQIIYQVIRSSLVLDHQIIYQVIRSSLVSDHQIIYQVIRSSLVSCSSIGSYIRSFPLIMFIFVHCQCLEVC